MTAYRKPPPLVVRVLNPAMGFLVRRLGRDLGGKRVLEVRGRKSGEAVPTTLWFALVDGRLYATTPPDSGKMKRIRNDPRVILTPCNAWGMPRGEGVEGLSRAIDGAAPEQAEAVLREKYRLGLALLHLFGEHEIGRVTLEVSPADAEGA